ncbi:MAG: dihydrolipoyllysine-residue acetyltransferase [Verrucomicrobia bacterium]|nr:dihydrolipoyllysine-residue acetyltransferase [Verrucomicrobiota bacterium]
MSESKQILVPDVGNDEVEIIEIFVAVGDTINAEESIPAVETDKATMDIPAPFTGEITELKVAVGDKIKQGDLIGVLQVLAVEGGEADASDEAPAEQEVVEETASVEEEVVAEPVQKGGEKESSVAETRPAVASGGAGETNVYTSPSIRRTARQFGVDLTKVTGTGRKGRILKEDMHLYVKGQLANHGGGSASTAGGLNVLAAAKVDFSLFGEVEERALTRIQKISGPNLHRNWVTIPHVTQFDETDITDLESFRKEQNATVQKQELGFKITPLVFIMKAAASALAAYPIFNSSLSADGENLVMKKYCHLGVAVETANGLVVPVVRDVDKKGIYELSKELLEISQKARAGKLTSADMQGSCFTLSSLGGIGGTAFTPIINAPDVAILGVSRSEIKAKWNGSEFEPRLMLPLALSYDHRVIDGAVAARFIVHLSGVLSDLRRLAL